jgi:hypothetical protein
VLQSLVPTGRLELPRLSPLPPQDSVSTNFTTSAVRESNYIFLQQHRHADEGFARVLPCCYFGTSPAFDAGALAGAAGAGTAGAGVAGAPSTALVAGTSCITPCAPPGFVWLMPK